MGFWAIFFIIATLLAIDTGMEDITVTVLFAGLAVLFTYLWATKDKKGTKKPPVTGSGGSSDGGYEGSTHYGTDTSGAPTTVHTSYGRTVDTTGTYWRERPDGSRENIFGETVEKNAYGQWEYTDSDGDTDDRATFDWD